MPSHPNHYKQLDWKNKALLFDSLVFDFTAKEEFLPLIWIDSASNKKTPTFGLYTAMGDVRQGYKGNESFHESLTSLGAILSAGLMGIDKTNQDGYNYVKMIQNYWNTDNGWNIMMNNTSPEVALLGGGYGRDWWYDVYPNVLYYGVSYLFPNVENADNILRNIADKFYEADKILNGNYHYSYFDYGIMQGKQNHIPYQEDAAAGHAYVLLCAYEKFKDEKYLRGAKSAMNSLMQLEESRYYEVLLPFGAYVAAKMNAEYGTDYDVIKILDWTFEGCKATDGRTGWGVISEKWGDYDVYGLQGSITDGGGYAFLMNTYSLAWPLVSMVRYQPQYAKAIGKWMLNASNSSKLFYPDKIPDENQWLPEKKKITNGIIAYEGLRKTDVYGKPVLKGKSPVALGDGPNWAKGQPDVSMFSVYSSAYAGIFGSIISETNIGEVLKLDCLATDFYRKEAYQTSLYYNPHNKPVEIVFDNTSGQAVDLFNALTHEIVAKDIKKTGVFTMQPDSASLIVAIPSNSKITLLNGKYMSNDIVIAYQ
ncbi:MAG: hypothetical protein U1C58_04315 [Flavobacteriaceae bacterium]|nr:hypothetical protein [Flavobacteriaceae bacterium]